MAPHMVHWEFATRSAPWDRDTGMIAVLNIKLLPEPAAWLLLVVGACVLALLRRVSRRG